MTATIPCGAHDLSYPQPHTCEDPVTCAVESLLAETTPLDDQLHQACEIIDEIAALVAKNKTKLAEQIRKVLDQ